MPASQPAPPRQRRARWLLLGEVALLVAALVVARSILVATSRQPTGDILEYHVYALNFWTVHPYFTSLPVEYPPLAILPFSLTLAPPLPDYQTVFVWWATAAIIAGYLGFLRYADRKRALAYFVYLVLGAIGTVISRFDIFPALVTVAALWAAQRRHFAGSYLLLALGTLLKLYPAFLLPIVLIEHWRALTVDAPARGVSDWLRAPATRRVAEGLALFAGAVGLGFAVAAALDPSGALTVFTYASARPLQVESSPATLLWLGSLLGFPAHPEFSFASLNYVGPLDVFLKPLSSVALAAGCLWAYWRFARGRLNLAQAFLAVLCVVVVANKIFSPQYLVWLVPFVAEVYGFDALWLVICAITTLIYPYLYSAHTPILTTPNYWAFMPIVALRNILLLSFTLRAILGVAQSHSPARLTEARPGAALPDLATPTPGQVGAPDGA